MEALVEMEAAPVGMEAHDLLLLGVTSSAAAATFLCYCEGGVAPVEDGGMAPIGDGWGWAALMGWVEGGSGVGSES
ncbi:hypothetical protein H5410_027878 [Solanum commersonii]|uniref:Uncharacterized protein n=1 Tax=Solanum commersonii TaxID=4109 RepID=A0A9J5Z131_SOLCO|nr:hypothetical protein H5410_027878 [Solanum commersonii]